MRLNLQTEKELWLKWWQSAGFKSRHLPLLGAAAYITIYVASGFFRADHLAFAAIILVLWYGGLRTRELFRFLLPLLLVAMIYDSMRFYSDYIRGPIHVAEPYNFDKALFGIHTDQGVLTPNEWLQLHTHPLLDLITGAFYLGFIALYVLICAYFCFMLPRTGTKKRSPEFIREQTYRPMWAFFWVNVIGYSTYYWYAAAPPWYVAEHGLGPADLTVASNAAGCLRFDQLMGTHFFTGMYGRAADVFGAIPSLHVAYPLQSIYYAQRYGALRGFTIFFYLIMCFSAVYLNHHYILDILWGSAYAILVCVFLDWRAKRKSGITV